MSADNRTAWRLAVYYWSPYLSTALLAGRGIIEVTTHRLRHGIHDVPEIQNCLTETAIDYVPDYIVLERDTPFHDIAAALNLPIETISQAEVGQQIMGTTQPTLRQKLYRRLVEQRPELQRIASLVGEGETTANTNHRRASQLLAIALGLAAHEIKTSIRK